MAGTQRSIGAWLFVYGTLAVPEVMETVTGRRFAYEAAELPEHGRYQLRDRIYPGATPEIDARTPGLLYAGIDERSLAVLDRFEDDFYERETHEVAGREAFVYVIPPSRRRLLLPEPWDPEDFVQLQLPQYLEACRRFRAGLPKGLLASHER